MSPSILIVGCGSIGERHLRCFQKTGRCRVSVCDANAALLQRVAADYSAASFPNLEAALVAEKFDALVICTPAHTHLAIARRAVEAGAALFIEKPLSVTFDGIEETRQAIARHDCFTAVAYVYHLMPWIREAREFLRGGSLGAVLQAVVTSGQHFPTFRPAYRDIYYNNHATGGGAVQDALTHLVNAVEWIIGPTTRVFCDASHQMLEGVKVEDTADVCARHGSILASYAMSQFQSPNESVFQFHCERGSVKIESHALRWGVLRRGERDWSWRQTAAQERDDLFTAQAHAFLDGLEGKPNPLCTFDEAVQTLKFNQAALRSISTGWPIAIA
ncbi:MAG TPA: Gfo/Idh/MocA family oxidoreductase [Verrucomicrobiaceae bacterium]|jgi:predicted dehydrogenase